MTNFVYKDRFLALVNISDEECGDCEQATHLVVLKKNMVTRKRDKAKNIFKGVGK